MSGATERPVNGEHVTNDAGDCISTCPACAAIVKAQRAPFTSNSMLRARAVIGETELHDWEERCLMERAPACKRVYLADEADREIERLTRVAAEVDLMAVTMDAREQEIERLTRELETSRSIARGAAEHHQDACLTCDRLRVALQNLYGIAQDLHSHLQVRTSVAETQRFMPAILAAHEALSGEPGSSPETESRRFPPASDIAYGCPTEFAEWLQRKIPPGTVISSPTWWAPRIYRRALESTRASSGARPDQPHTRAQGILDTASGSVCVSATDPSGTPQDIGRASGSEVRQAREPNPGSGVPAPGEALRCKCGHSDESHYVGSTNVKGPCIVCSCMQWRLAENASDPTRGNLAHIIGCTDSPEKASGEPT